MCVLAKVPVDEAVSCCIIGRTATDFVPNQCGYVFRLQLFYDGG